MIPSRPRAFLIFLFLVIFPAVLVAGGGRQDPSETEPAAESPESQPELPAAEEPEPAQEPAPQADPRSSDTDLDTHGELEGVLSDTLQVLDELILSGPRDSEVLGIYSQVRSAMNNGRIQVLFESDQILSGAAALNSVYFSADGAEDAPGYLVVNGGYFQLVNSQPSLALSLLVEAMAHAANYLRLGTVFQDRYQQPVDRYLFSMDALYLQALFVDQYLAGVYSLSPFEEYLLEGLEVDRLASVSLYFRGIDQEIVYTLIEQTDAVREELLGLPDFIAQVVDLVDLIAEQHSQVFAPEEADSAAQEGTDDEEFLERSRYITTVSAGTYLKYGVWVINALLSDMQPEIQADPDLTAAVRNLNENSALLYQQFLKTAYDVVPFRDAFVGDFFDEDS